MLHAFAQGSGAEITERIELVPDRPAVLYGVDRQTLPLWREIERTGHPYYYIDNGYMNSRWQGGDHYRITKNAPQCSGFGESTGERWRALGLTIQPWKRSGSHILIPCQSDFWHERHGDGSAAAFGGKVTAELRKHTKRRIVVRAKPLKEPSPPRTLVEDLRDCWAVVTYSSMVALEAILDGVPAFALAKCALSPMSGAIDESLALIETPFYPTDRERWASVLADNQWTLDEIRSGTCWQALNNPTR